MKKINKKLIMNEEDEKISKKRQNVISVIKKYNNKDIRVSDHCHITGKYRGSSHQDCNVNFRLTDKIPIVYNLRGYDSHFIMQEIGQIKRNINFIPNNMEKYMAFMLGKKLVFIVSFQFMSSSLDKLVQNLPENKFKYT